MRHPVDGGARRATPLALPFATLWLNTSTQETAWTSRTITRFLVVSIIFRAFISRVSGRRSDCQAAASFVTAGAVLFRDFASVGSGEARSVEPSRWPPPAAQTARADFPQAAFTMTPFGDRQGKESDRPDSPAATRRRASWMATCAIHPPHGGHPAVRRL